MSFPFEAWQLIFWLIIFFWIILFTKSLFFWVWLWQLKEYRWGRFKAHFQTHNGKKAIFFHTLQRSFKYPKLTKKTIVILFSGILVEFLIFLIFLFFLPGFLFYLALLISIILAPVIFSLFVLFFQIPTVILHNRILKKAKRKREKFKDLLVIGITGSFGKTSTKEFLAEILSEKYNVLKTKEHQNTEIGVSQYILNNLQPEHEIFVCEMGAYQRGEIKLLAKITQPKIGILTGINEQHLATFGSLENIIKTKYELIEALPRDGLAVFNGSNPYTFRLYLKTEKPKKVYRCRAAANHVEPDIFAKDIVIEKKSIGFRIYPKNEQPLDFKINVLGAQNVPNLLSAILVARELGMSWEEIFRGCQKIRPGQGTMQLKSGINGINIIDSTFSANPDGVIADLDYLRIWPGKKIVVMPCLIELGKASKEIHKRIGKKIGQVCDLAIITTKERFKEIKKGAIEKGLQPTLFPPASGLLKEENILFIEKPKETLERIKVFCKPGDVILLESRVPAQLIKQLI